MEPMAYILRSWALEHYRQDTAHFALNHISVNIKIEDGIYYI